MFGMTATTTTKKRRKFLSATSDKFMDIIEDMVKKNESFDYDTMCDMMWGKTSDGFQRFYQRSVVSALFYRMRHVYKLHIYQIGETVLVLRTKEQFNEIIQDHEKRIDGLRAMIRQLESDKANINSGRYERELKQRFEDMKAGRKGGDKDVPTDA